MPGIDIETDDPPPNVPKNGIKGEPGRDGQNGSDASVTKSAITSALGRPAATTDGSSIYAADGSVVPVASVGALATTNSAVATNASAIAAKADKSATPVVSGDVLYRPDGTTPLPVVSGSVIELGDAIPASGVVFQKGADGGLDNIYIDGVEA